MLCSLSLFFLLLTLENSIFNSSSKEMCMSTHHLLPLLPKEAAFERQAQTWKSVEINFNITFVQLTMGAEFIKAATYKKHVSEITVSLV